MRQWLLLLSFMGLLVGVGFAQEPSMSFQAFHQRNPFVLENSQTVINKTVVNHEPDRRHTKQPLEDYPLSSLRYVGMIAQGDKRWGLIRCAENIVVSVQVGSYVGQQQGQVMAIDNQSVTLSEWLQLPDHTWQRQTVALSLGGDQ